MSEARCKNLNTCGFTLIELSIVMVIIGLIIGGILVGRDLINSAASRAYISQLQTYNTAVNAFKLKYGCLPGDCANGVALNFLTNGNGNGFVGGLQGWPSNDLFDTKVTATDVTSVVQLGCCGGEEGQYFWDHLRLSLLIPEYTSTMMVADGVGAGFPIPAAKNDGSGIILVAWKGKHYFRSGAWMTHLGGNVLWKLNFKPVDAAYIFDKIGGTTITTSNTYGGLQPDNLGKERVIVTDTINAWQYNGIWYDTTFYNFQSQGAGGTTADYCINTSATPAYFNLKNPKILCGLIIQADF